MFRRVISCLPAVVLVAIAVSGCGTAKHTPPPSDSTAAAQELPPVVSESSLAAKAVVPVQVNVSATKIASMQVQHDGVSIELPVIDKRDLKTTSSITANDRVTVTTSLLSTSGNNTYCTPVPDCGVILETYEFATWPVSTTGPLRPISDDCLGEGSSQSQTDDQDFVVSEQPFTLNGVTGVQHVCTWKNDQEDNSGNTTSAIQNARDVEIRIGKTMVEVNASATTGEDPFEDAKSPALFYDQVRLSLGS